MMQGFRIIGEVNNGRDALHFLQREIPHLIVTDIRMPEMDGIEFIRRVRDQLPHIPIIILSGYDEFSYARDALRFGVIDYLLKPINRVEFVKCLKKIEATYLTEHVQDSEKASLNRNNPVIQRIKKIIEQNLEKELSLQYVSEQVHMNYNYLSSLFRSETGTSFSDYLMEARMEKAKTTLKNTNLKVYEIAEMCGYTSPKHFMSVFRKKMGCTPSEYRER
jgi:two-component system response regulator YesN